MSYLVVRVLDSAECERIVQGLAAVPFVDGKATAGKLAAEVKNNLQMQRQDQQPQGLDHEILVALKRNETFKAQVIPQRIALPLFAKYEPGMEYGLHVDSAIMGQTELMRTDMAMTIFLTPPTSYDGGELIVHEALGEQEIKLDAGEAVVYPATTLHRVAPVTRGQRIVAVTWIQSLVRDPQAREILADLHSLIEDTTLTRNQRMRLGKCQQNLLRLVCEP
jgi:PKHD-type hydroxylase